jgi:DNA polymerase-3 subunit gamma/tau
LPHRPTAVCANKATPDETASLEKGPQLEDEIIQPAAASEGHAPDGWPVNRDALWNNILDQVSEQKPSLAGFLGKCTLRSIAQGRMEMEVKGNDFTCKNIIRHKEALEAICSEQLGRKIELKVIANYDDPEAKLEQKEINSRLKQKAMSHPLVMEALELFDGRLIDIKTP